MSDVSPSTVSAPRLQQRTAVLNHLPLSQYAAHFQIQSRLTTSRWPSRCHCHSLSLAPVNPDWFYLSDTGSPGWSQTKSRRAVVRLELLQLYQHSDKPEVSRISHERHDKSQYFTTKFALVSCNNSANFNKLYQLIWKKQRSQLVSTVYNH